MSVTTYSGGDFPYLEGMQMATSDVLRKSAEVLLALNVNGDRVGSLTKRQGYTQIGATLGAAQDILGLSPYYPAGTTRYLIGIVNGASASVAYSTGGAWTSINSSQLAGAQYMGQQYLNRIFFVGYNSGTSVFASNFYITGTTFVGGGDALIQGMPQARYIKDYRDRLYVGNVSIGGTNYPSRIYYSSVPTVSNTVTWPAANNISVPSDDNDPISGLEVNSERLLIFKERSLYRWDNSSMSFVSYDGCPNGRTIFTVGSLTFFYSLNGKGIYVYSGGKPQFISKKIQPVMDSIDKTIINQYYAIGDYDHYYLYVGNFTLNLPNGDTQAIVNGWIVYTISVDLWHLYSTANAVRYMSRFVDANNNDRVVFGDTSGNVFTLADSSDSVFSDSGTAIAAQVRYRTVIGTPHQDKNIQRIYTLGDRMQGMLLRARADNKDWSRSFEINKNGQDTPFNLLGKTFEIEISESSTFAPFILNGFAMDVISKAKQQN